MRCKLCKMNLATIKVYIWYERAKFSKHLRFRSSKFKSSKIGKEPLKFIDLPVDLIQSAHAKDYMRTFGITRSKIYGN